MVSLYTRLIIENISPQNGVVAFIWQFSEANAVYDGAYDNALWSPAEIEGAGH